MIVGFGSLPYIEYYYYLVALKLFNMFCSLPTFYIFQFGSKPAFQESAKKRRGVRVDRRKRFVFITAAAAADPM